MKCIVGNSDGKSSTDCTNVSSGLDRCMNMTTDGVSTSTSYQCVLASAIISATSGITDKKCTTTTVDGQSVETCLCDTDDCNMAASSGSELKCHVGESKDTALATTLTCGSGKDRCAKVITDGNPVWICMLAATATSNGFTDEVCSTVNSTELCLCKGDGCNNDAQSYTTMATTEATASSTQSATKAIIFFAAVSSIMKLALL